MHGKPAQDEKGSPPFPQRGIVCAAVQESTFHGAQVFLPLRLEMDERPLSPAEHKVLQPRKLKIFFFAVKRHD